MKPYFLGLATLVVVGVGCSVDTANFMGTGVVDKGRYIAPPAEMLNRPGPMVDGPGPGVLPMMYEEPAMSNFVSRSSQVFFKGPDGMSIGWQINGGYAENQLIAPGRYDFAQGQIYRLKLAGIPDRPDLVLYPTLHVYPAGPQTDAFLSHSPVPLQITDQDLQQVASNNFLTKVVYLPDPQHQELAIAGVDTLVSTQLDPGADPIAEADRRGTIMLVLRVGNLDLETGSVNVPGPAAQVPGKLDQVSFKVDGDQGQRVPPMPIGMVGQMGGGVPAPMMMGMPGMPGQGAVHPISGVGPTPVWGMTSVGTPIGLPGPPHLPYGRPAGLQSYTVRNQTKMRLPEPTDHMLIDVKHNPGIRMPKPVKHIQYTENHPEFRQPVTQEGYGAGEYCPPGQ